MSAPPDNPPLSREAQANAEVGVTVITRAQAAVLVAAFLTLIFSVPVVQQIRERREPGAEPRWFGVSPRLAETFQRTRQDIEARGGVTGVPPRLDRLFLDNRALMAAMKEYEDSLVDDSLLTRAFLPPVQRALTRFLGAGNEKAYVGRGGWLFYRPDVDYALGQGFYHPRRFLARARSGSDWQAPPQPDPLIAILQFHKQLAERGIRLVIVPTPVKPVVHPEMFTRRYSGSEPPCQNPSWDPFVAELRRPADFFARYEALLAPYRDVPEAKARRAWYWPLRKALAELAAARDTIEKNPVLLFDPAPILAEAKARTGRPQYLDTDTHWTPEAMQTVAAALGDFVEQNVPLPTVPPPRYKRLPMKVSNLGDIAVMMKLPESQTLYPKREVTIQQVVLEEPQWRPDPQADVLLLGDSFSNIYSADSMGWGEAAGFAEQLSVELQRPLDALIRNDAGAYATREMLSQELARGQDRLAGKKVVIWQFAARELTGGDWRPLPMQLGAARESRFLQVAEGESRLVRGVVREATSAPRPGTVTYPDHVVQVHLSDLRSADGQPLDAGDAVVAIYSMRNQVWTDAARYRPGQKVTLRVRNFDEMNRKHKVGSVKSSLLGGDLALEPACWAEPPQPETASRSAAGSKPEPSKMPETMGLVFVLAVVVAVVIGVDRTERKRIAKAPANRSATS